MADGFAGVVLEGYEAFRTADHALTQKARARFEARDWEGAQADAVERLSVYARSVQATLEAAARSLGADARSAEVWSRIRSEYERRIASHPDAPLAETFFNSVTRQVFATVGVDRQVEFVHAAPAGPLLAVASPVVASPHSPGDPWPASPADPSPAAIPAAASPPAAPSRASHGPRSTVLPDGVIRRFERAGTLEDLVSAVLEAYAFSVPYEETRRDAHRVAAEILRRFSEETIEAIETIRPVFYRNKGAYIVGRIRTFDGDAPLTLALLNPHGRIVVDAALLTETEVSIVFSFTRSYFRVDTDRPSQLVAFLQSIMPRKPVAELYNAIGLNKHGKTEFYRALLRQLVVSDERFEPAPGARGMVMAVFTMPSYDVVFKVIRDHFPPPKKVTRREVMEKYALVTRHDRAGRLVEAQEFEHLRFDRRRFSKPVLDELLETCAGSVRIEGGAVVFRHLYTERRIVPLDIFLERAGEERAHAAVTDYGQAIRELAATDLFPGDLLTKNFGVTRHGRVVFYDYDEICPLRSCRFRRIPPPRTPEDELAAEPWFHVADEDIFPEEFVTFLGLRGSLRDAFLGAHGELLEAAWWTGMQERLRDGIVIDLYPYRPERHLWVGRTPDWPGRSPDEELPAIEG